MVLAGGFARSVESVEAGDCPIDAKDLAQFEKAKPDLFKKFKDSFPNLPKNMFPADCSNLQRAVAAESASGKGFLSTALGWLSGITAQPALIIWFVLLYIAQTVLTWILSFVSFFLNNIFYYAIILNPSNMPVVVEGWVYLRDIVNGIFILMVLWIALTVIFDVEQYGGKKLLFRLITVALLINFSLALVSVTFGLANQLSLPFYNVIRRANGGDLAGLIISNTQTHTIFQSVSKNNKAAAQNVKLGIDQTNGCGFNALAPGLNQKGLGCVGADSMAGEFALSYVDGFISGADILGLLNLTISLAISLIILSAVIAAMIGISAILLVRIIYMVFLGIMAPAAFAAIIIPGAGEVWKMWQKKLFCWAFVAPAFYFLFYMSLRILSVMTQTRIVAATTGLGVLGNLLNIIPFLVFLGFLVASLRVGKWMGCTALGEVGVDFAKKLGRAAVVGTAQLGLAAVSGGTSMVAGRVAGTVAGAARGLATRPGVGRFVAGIAGPAADKLIRGRRTVIKDAKERVKEMDADEIVSNFRRPRIKQNADELIGNAQALLEKNSLTKLTIQEQHKVRTLAEQVGIQHLFDNANPLLAVKLQNGEKITHSTDLGKLDTLVEKMKPKAFADVDFAAVAQERDDSEADIVYQRMFRKKIETGGPEHMGEFYKTLVEMPKETKEKVLRSWKAVINDRQQWTAVQQSDPTVYNNYIRMMAGKAGRRWVDKDEMPNWLKQEATRLEVEGFKPPKQQRGGGGQGGYRQGGGGAQNPPAGGQQGQPPQNPPPGAQGGGQNPPQNQPPNQPQNPPRPLPGNPVLPNPPGPGTASAKYGNDHYAAYADVPENYPASTHANRAQRIGWIQKRKKDEILRLNQHLLDKEADILRAKIKQIESEYDELEEIK